MLRVAIAVAVVVAAGCGSKDREGKRDETGGAHVHDAGPAAIDAAPIELGELEAWAAAAGDVVVHAVQADGNALRLLLVDRDSALLAPAVDGVEVTGRVATATVDEARAALIAAYPALGPARAPVFRDSKSTRIDLRFERAAAVDLFRVLGGVVDQNVVVVAEDLPDVSVAIRRVPVSSFIDVYADLLDVRVDKRKYAWFVRRESDPEPDEALLGMGGSKIDIEIEGARAGEVAALVNLVQRSGTGAPCDLGPALRLDMDDAPVGTVLAAAQVRSGVALRGADTTCAARPLEAAPGDAVLVAIARHRKRVIALFRAGAGVSYVEGETTLADGTEIRVLWHLVKVAGRDVYLHTDWVDDDVPRVNDALLARSRLAATVIAGKERHALVELPDGGGTAVISTDRRRDARPRPAGAEVSEDAGIRPGRVYVSGFSGGPELRLHRR